MPLHNPVEILYFRRWSRKKFGIFRSLKKVVHIGVLLYTSSILTGEIQAGNAPDTLLITRNLDGDEIEITAEAPPGMMPQSARPVVVLTRGTLSSLPAGSLSSALLLDVSADIRQRGAPGVQADLGIRGGTFDQSLLMIDNIPFRNAQTGHHQLDIPLHTDWAGRIEIVKGPAARQYGVNAFSGAVLLVPLTADTNVVSFVLEGGSHALFNARTLWMQKGKRSGGFVGVSHSSTAGFAPNTDASLQQVFGKYDMKFGKTRWQGMGGYSHKAFGANRFYSPKYPGQFEETHSAFVSLSFERECRNVYFRPSVYLRNHFDRFELFRTAPPPGYKGHNYHSTLAAGFRIPLSIYSKWGTTSLGLEGLYDRLFSNVLGDPLQDTAGVPFSEAMYTKGASRSQVQFYTGHSIETGRWHISGGVMLSKGDGLTGWEWFPGIESSYRLHSYWKLYASVNRAMRLPTFTDLYYQGPVNLPNPDLRPETVQAFEAGVRFQSRHWKASLEPFYRQGSQLIDWVKFPGQEQWKSMNHTRVDIYGLEITIASEVVNKTTDRSWIQQWGLSYAYLQNNARPGVATSRYALDPLCHNFRLFMIHQPVKSLLFSWILSYQQRRGSYTAYLPDGSETLSPYQDVLLLHLKIKYVLGPLTAYAMVSNLTDAGQFDHGGVPLPGRWMTAGLEYRLFYKN